MNGNFIIEEPRWTEPENDAPKPELAYSTQHSGPCDTPYAYNLGHGSIWRCECGTFHQFNRPDPDLSGKWKKISRRKARRYMRRKSKAFR